MFLLFDAQALKRGERSGDYLWRLIFIALAPPSSRKALTASKQRQTTYLGVSSGAYPLFISPDTALKGKGGIVRWEAVWEGEMPETRGVLKSIR